jgi:hypothetical protein
MTRRIPVLLVVVHASGARKQCLLENSRIPRLIESGDPKLLVCIFLDYAKPNSSLDCVSAKRNQYSRVLMSIETCHKNQRHVDTMSRIEMLNLSNRKIKKSHIVFDFQR